MSNYNFVDVGAIKSRTIDVPATARVIFVSDLFHGEYVGGAELSNKTLIDASPIEVFCVKSKNVTMELLQQHQNKHWVFANLAEIDLNLIPTIAVNMQYSAIEYDFKWCKYRSPRRHAEIEQKPCDCTSGDWGKLFGLYFNEAKSIYFMSEKQQDEYFSVYPFLKDSNKCSVLSSLFDKDFFQNINILRASKIKSKNEKYVILNSPNWIKGTEDCIKYCEENQLDYDLVYGLPYVKLLEKLAESKGFVLMPKDWDTCPRMAIEAKLLGCDVRTNSNVLHASEEWFATSDVNQTTSYLFMGPQRFWNGVLKDIDYMPTISGYTTVYNAIKGDFPFEACINSMVESGLCDEVVVLDGGSNDGTWEKIQDMAKGNLKIRAYQNKVDWGTKAAALADGQQKAYARSLCKCEFCWQQDSDEVLHEDDAAKVKNIVKHFPKNVDIVSLPVVEYWGMSGKVRADIVPQKWRLSRNKANITHGLPRQLRDFDASGDVIAKPHLSDGCDYIDINSFSPQMYISFYDQQAEGLRRTDKGKYEQYYNWACNNFPTVTHFSWYNLARKIKSFRDFWQNQWNVLYGVKTADTAENNIFFDKPWADVTEQDIKDAATRLEQIGPRICHTKVDWSKDTSSELINCTKSYPKYVLDWINKQKGN